MTTENKFEVFYKFVGWGCISLGIHIDITAPRVEIHIPSGWIRVGWNKQTCRVSSWEEGLHRLI